MRRLRSHLSASILWVVALWLAALAVGFLGVHLGLAAAATLAAAALASSLFVLIRAERRLKRKLSSLVGTTKVGTVEDVIGGLVLRIEQLSQHRDALTALRHPVLLADSAGFVLAASEGMRRIIPSAKEGMALTAIFGDGLPAPGNGAERRIATVGGARYELTRGKTPGGRSIIEFAPHGEFVADDEIDAFRTAINEGQTQLRFDAAAAGRSQVLVAFNEAIHALEEAAVVADTLTSGQPFGAGENLSSALAPRLRTLSAHHVAMMQLLLEANREKRRLEQLSRVDDAPGKSGAIGYSRSPQQTAPTFEDANVVPMRAAGGRG